MPLTTHHRDKFVACGTPDAGAVIPVQRCFLAHPFGEFVKVGVEVW